MTLNDKLAAMNVTVTVSDETASAMGLFEDTYEYSYADIKAMSSEDRMALRKKCEHEMDFGNQDRFSDFYDLYCTISRVEDDEYREENMDSFREFESHMHEPDFDWGFYSDWHKDMFGYRPHYNVIPENEAHREAMFMTFHRNQGF